MNADALKIHGHEVIQAAKGHLVATLASAPAQGWELSVWAQAAGMNLPQTTPPDALVQILAEDLVREGRVRRVSEDPVRYGAESTRSTFRLEGRDAPAIAAPEVWSPAETDLSGVESAESATEGPQVVSSGHGPT